MRNVVLVIRLQIVERDQGVGDIPFADFSQEAVRATPSRQLLPLVMEDQAQRPITSPVSCSLCLAAPGQGVGPGHTRLIVLSQPSRIKRICNYSTWQISC